MDLEKDNFEEDELSGLEEDGELGGEDVVETEEEELIIGGDEEGDEEPAEAPAPKAKATKPAPVKPAAKSAPKAAAKKPAPFEKLDAEPGIFQLEGCREPGQPGPDDRYALDSHDLTTTRSFSLLESAARARKGRPGSRSIFFRSSP